MAETLRTLPGRHWDWGRSALLVWVVLAVGLSIYGYLNPMSHNVFYIYAQAARRWWVGEDIYSHVVKTDYYRYSPLFAIVITPFTLLPNGWGNALWRVFNYAIYAAGLWAWMRHALPACLTRNQRAALFLLVLPISLHSLYNGQANVLMLATILLGVADAAQDRWNGAAGWLAAATLLKCYPLALGLVMAALFPRRFAWRYVCALGLGLLLPFATADLSFVFNQYASWWVHLNDSTVIMRERLRTLEHLLSIYGYGVAPRTFMVFQFLGGLVILCLCALQASRTSDRRLLLGSVFSFFAVWVALFGPATEACTYIVIAPAVAWALVEAFSPRGSWQSRIPLVASLMLMGPCSTDLVGPPIRNFANEHGSQPIGGLLILVSLLIKFAHSICAHGSGESARGLPSFNVAA